MSKEMAERHKRKRRSCDKCWKGNRFTPKETCIVCSADYCYKCVVRAMGSMPEGRKCLSCIGLAINENSRRNLGKSSRLLKQLFLPIEVERIMRAEKSCEANQPEVVFVNSQRLSQREFSLLRTCRFPPRKLDPGFYWYDRLSGLWGKKGQKPCQIISPELNIGGRISREASNGNTNVLINNREITRSELLMLQLVGVKVEGATHFWVSPNGNYQEEGMTDVKGNIWEKITAKLICIALSLPIPPGEQANLPIQKSIFKLFLVGCGNSGSSTFFNQAKIIYNSPFSEEDRQKIKLKIQSNLYGYLGILIKGCAQFEEENLIRKKKYLSDHCSSSENSSQFSSKSIYLISPKLKPFSDWLLKTRLSGNSETEFTAANGEFGHSVEDLWNDSAIQATYSRRDELEILPRVASYFLERAVEISKQDYEPSNFDMLYAEGITSSNGLPFMEFSFPSRPQDSSIGYYNEHDLPTRYQLLRANSKILGGNCKWLDMFEDVDIVLFCISLIDYNEYFEQNNGLRVNRMMASKQLFERFITHPRFKEKKFLLILNKFDLLEEKIEQFPLSQCEWFHDFNPVIGHNPNPYSSTARSTNTSLAHRAFQYIAVKFKRLFSLLNDGKLFATVVTALDPENVDEALRYAKEILSWKESEDLAETSYSTSFDASQPSAETSSFSDEDIQLGTEEVNSNQENNFNSV